MTRATRTLTGIFWTGTCSTSTALRDALVLELPLAPLCAEDCPGLCSECGVRLADAGAGHAHADAGTTEPTPDGSPVPETRKES